MSDSEASKEAIKKSLKYKFDSFVHPSLGTDKLIALKRSVRNKKLEREEKILEKTGNDRETEDESSCKNIDKVESKLSVLLDKNSETDQKEIGDEIFRKEKEDERKMSSNMIQDTDQLEEKM